MNGGEALNIVIKNRLKKKRTNSYCVEEEEKKSTIQRTLPAVMFTFLSV
jgi:hypothetical protein